MTDTPSVEKTEPRRLDDNVLLRPGHRKRRAGTFLMSASPVVMTIALLVSAFTINPCGALGDVCDDYGHSTSVGQIALYVAFGAGAAFFTGVAIRVVGLMQRR